MNSKGDRRPVTAEIDFSREWRAEEQSGNFPGAIASPHTHEKTGDTREVPRHDAAG
jgi:hypothetical protein